MPCRKLLEFKECANGAKVLTYVKCSRLAQAGRNIVENANR